MHDELFGAILIGERAWPKGPVCRWSGDRLSSARASLGDAAGRGTTGSGTQPSPEDKQSSGEEDWETTNWATAPERDADTGMCTPHTDDVSMIHTHDYCIYLAITRLRWSGGHWGASCHRQKLEFWYDGEYIGVLFWLPFCDDGLSQKYPIFVSRIYIWRALFQNAINAK